MSMQLIEGAVIDYLKSIQNYDEISDVINGNISDTLVDDILESAYMHKNDRNVETAKNLLYNNVVRCIQEPTSLMSLSKKILSSLLKEKSAVVTFTKKNGEERVMNCTLIENLIPEDQRPKGVISKKSDNALSVWDLDANGWRSFVYDNVKKIKWESGS